MEEIHSIKIFNKRNKNSTKGYFLFILFFWFLNFILLYFFFKNKIPNEFLNIFIVAHKDFPNKLTNESYKIICDNKTQLKNKYQLRIIEAYKDNELYPKKRGYSDG